MAEAGFGTRLEQPELGIGQPHLGADLVRRLFPEVKAYQNLAIPGSNTFQDSYGDLLIFLPDGGLFGIAAGVAHGEAPVEVKLLLAAEDVILDLRSYLPAHDGPDIAHQAVRLAQLSPLDGLRHDDESIVDPVIQILGAQLPAQIEANATRKDPVQFFQSVRLVPPDFFDQFGPTRLRGHRPVIRIVRRHIICHHSWFPITK
ncbi:MAG TPA: hypothetical protein VMG35_31010 [Bryobacteraceae bacterium]|nr:hypothetical protein [Bryobacteraceae bacterium]